MYIEFDVAKNATNLKDRGLSFDLAAGFDFHSALIWQDLRKSYPEVRFAALGLLD